MRGLITVACVVLGSLRAAEALDPDRAVTQYGSTVWNVERGLPQDFVTAITQTHDGLIWIGTQEGFARFDGVSFEVFDRTTQPAMQSSFVTALFEDHAGTLWIGTRGGGLLALVGGQLRAYHEADGLVNESINALAEYEGALWIGTNGGGLVKLEHGRFTTFATKDGLPNLYVRALALGADGELWIGSRGGLTELKEGRFTTYDQKAGLGSDMVMHIEVDRDGVVWVSTRGGGVSRRVDGKWITLTKRDGLSGDSVWSTHRDRDDNVWIATDRGLDRYRDGRITSLVNESGLAAVGAISLYEDLEGGLWVGTLGGGVQRLQDGRLSTITMKEGLSGNSVWSVMESRAGEIWVGTENGIDILAGAAIRHLTPKDGLENSSINSIIETRDGAIWIATPTAIQRYVDGRFVGRYTAAEGVPGRGLVLYEDRGGTLWLGMLGGVVRFEGDRFVAVPGAPTSAVHTILETTNGELWFGTELGVARLVRGAAVSLGTSKAPEQTVNALFEDTHGAIWIGAQDGVWRWKAGQFVQIGDAGLRNQSIYQLMLDDRETLWIGTGRGIYRIRLAELDASANGDVRNLTVEVFGAADGMKTRDCNGGVQPATLKSRDGRLWFSTSGGLVQADPSTIQPSAPPFPAFIDKVLVDRRAVPPGRVHVAAGAKSLEIRYSTPSYDNPEKITFQYKLDGFDTEWVDAGSRRVAFYTNVPPGDLVFRVRVRGSSGVWPSTYTSIEITVDRVWWRTPWLIAVGVLGVIAVFAGAYTLRIRNLRKQREHLEREISERTRDLVKTNDQLTIEMAERARLEEERQLSQKLESIGQLAAGIAHEINTPTQFILSNTEFLEATIDQLLADVEVIVGHVATTPVVGDVHEIANRLARELAPLRVDVAESVAALHHGTSTISQIVSAMREFARADQREMTPSDVNRAITVTAEVVRSEYRDLATLDLALGVIPSVRCHVGEIHQLVANLLINAAHAIADSTRTGMIVVRTRRVADRVEIEVVDNGCGIAVEHQHRIFDPFFTTKAVGHGSGQGLAIVRRIVDRHHGKLTFRSVVGEGTTFVVSLPIDGRQVIAPTLDRSPDQRDDRIQIQ